MFHHIKKKKKPISTQNHAEVKEVQFELILTLKLTERERLPRRRWATPSRQTGNGTVNRHHTYIHRCKELYPTQSVCANAHSGHETQDETDTKEPRSLIKHWSYLELKHCCHRKTPDYEADPILTGRIVPLNEC